MIERLKKNLINIPGKRLKKKLLVFESDDWGAIRIPSKKVRDLFLSKKLLSNSDPFSMFDALESESDMLSLYEVLHQFKDAKGNHPIFTTNFVVGNPDFDKIRESDFQHYYYECFTETYKKYENSSNTFGLIQDGIRDGLILPQYHAREHLNFILWMELLQNNNKSFHEALKHHFFAIDFNDFSNRRQNLMATYDYYSKESLNLIKESIEDGLQLFKDTFKMNSRTTIAPCYVWDNKVEEVFLQHGVKYMQGSRFQQIPNENTTQFKKKFHYNGQKNNLGQTYFLRNGLFEPATNENIDWVDKCLESIRIAFKWNKPAIIGTHRLNYIGSMAPENRKQNLADLSELLSRIIDYWPDVEFVSSDELAKVYE